MFGKSFVLSVMIVTSAFTLVFGQTPEAPRDPDKAPKTFAFTFDGGGSYLGVQTQEVNRDNYANYGLRDVRGVAVEKVMENSPASAAGLQNRDVIVRFNGEDVTSSRKLTRLVSEIDPDHQARITVLRDGKEKELTATLAKRPGPKFENGAFNVGPMDLPDLKDLPELKDLPQGDAPQVFDVPGGKGKMYTFRTGGRQIGVGVTPLTKQLAAHFAVDGGIMVNDVREGSPAEKAGLKAGDIIVEADGAPVKDTMDLVKAITAQKVGTVSLTVVRNGSRQTITVTPEESKGENMMFQDDGENGLAAPAIPATPGVFRTVRPIAPGAPVIAPVPMTLAIPGRTI